MRRYVPYMIGLAGLLIVTVAIVVINRRLPKKMDERITLRERDKIPYGFSVAKELTASLFPNAPIYTDQSVPGYWRNTSMNSERQAVLIVGGYFNADDEEISRLMRFVKNGNYVFIIAQSFSEEAE